MHLEGVKCHLDFRFVSLWLHLHSNRIYHDCIYYVFIDYQERSKVPAFKVFIYDSDFLTGQQESAEDAGQRPSVSHLKHTPVFSVRSPQHSQAT